jgi:acetyltransferase-like isoleucine patch superfamily enzyme
MAIKMDLRRKIFFFSIYSYFSGIFYLLIEIVPPFIRNIIFKLIFKKLGKNCLLDYGTYFRYPSKISIGDNVFINRDCSLYASYMVPDVEIKIGNNVVLSPHVLIFTATHDYSTLDLVDVAASVIIEDNAWIGGGTIILPGVTIGEGAAIGAGSIVSRSIPTYCVAVGNPACVIKKRELV